ncbi:hypothetical protein OAJ44_05265 [Chloroflexi bacterium]|nr:hypothetical protein [Chloroflexota bacterium]
MAGKIYIVNVGSNASHNFCSPIFEDRTFEFIPIPEDRKLPNAHGLTYRQLNSFYEPERSISMYLPEAMGEVTAHNDPEFDTYTYGDNCEVNPRAMGMREVDRGDFLLFISRLQHWRTGKPTERYGFYFIGYLHVDQVLKSVSQQPSELEMQRFQVNSHIRRGMSDKSLWDNFWVFGGSSWSNRFYKAVPVTKDLCNKVFVTAAGTSWEWKEGRTDLQTIGSYTRTCRCVIDSSDPEGKIRAGNLWDWIDKYSR